MKRIFKVTAIIVLFCVMVVGTTIVATAANYYSINTSSTKWTTVGDASDGFNRKVRIYNHNLSLSRSDVRMLGKKGNNKIRRCSALRTPFLI